MDKGNIDDFERISSLNNYFICDYCNKQTTRKQGLRKHMEVCLSDRTCSLCKIVFKNRGNLVTHEYYIHEKEKVKNVDKVTICTICNIPFTNVTFLKYHNRKEHYNLTSKIPLAYQKKLNETWYEKVLNTDSIIEITKISQNILLLRKYVEDNPVLIEESSDVLNLNMFYPTAKNDISNCDICNIPLTKQEAKKHYQNVHSETKLFICNSCNVSFKRAHLYAKHKCNKAKNGLSVDISKTQSLRPIAV